MKGPVLLRNTKIDILVPLKCLSSDTGNKNQTELSRIISDKSNEEHSWGKKKKKGKL